MALSKVLVISLLFGLAASAEETCHADGTCLSGVEDVDPTEVNSVSLLQTQMKTTPILAGEAVAVYTPSEKKNPEDAVSLVEEGPEMAADMVGECDAKIERFDSLNNQLSFSAGYDPEFPPEMQSIGAAGSTCGDTAAGLSDGCEMYNKWKTMQDVAETHGNTFSVIGASGINWNDIQQGALGNCYFLASLAAIAKQQPDIIDNMFVDRDLWSQNIFKTKWFINGKESIVTVDNMIPAGDSGTFFTHQSPTGEFWPVILAKTWAKIYGNFKAVEGGMMDTAIRAITGSASVSITMSEQTADKLWDQLVTGTEQKFVMGAGTGGGGNPTTYGLAVGHAYGVLGAAVDGTYGKVVKMYNPWGSDNYVGGVPNTEEINGPNKGKFTMKFEEFMDAYSDASINFVISGYEVATIAVPAGKLTALDVTVSSPGKFWVSMVWPTQRMVAPCPYLNPSGFLKGALGGGGDDDASSQLPRMANSEALSAEFANPSGGTYNVLAIETFSSSAAWIKNIQLLVYAPGTAVVATSTESTEKVALKMFGPASGCEGITVAGVGFMKLDVSKTVAGVPTYWTSDGAKFLYYLTWSQKWNSIDGSDFEAIQAGGTSRYAEYDKSAMKCGCEDDPQGVVSWGVACDEVIAPNVRYGNVKCQGQSSSGAVQNACPKTCNVCPAEGDAGDSGGGGAGGGAVAAPACEDSTTYHSPDGDACSGWIGYVCSGWPFSTDLETNCPSACGKCTA